MSINPKKNARVRTRSTRAHRARRRIDVNMEAVDYLNVELLKKFVTEKGKILPRRITGMTAKNHRKLTRSIKRSRNVLLMK